ncbi:pentatricopeptide repeat-containing protein At5g24830 isoform X3 [Cynara cardunculus var. scolymus]|uniref:pentatricopeptide repeat-containing protein At5g24830 isoform X3 n=1 Tax=Cynara cardunculus var. scolymus TaxID=59895 RepID=UPI000D627ADD|nr:pentatricopeptide repeat-containing protein At5g24830 isoform X3 [Cynara cardunculus var. scolymus]
MFTCIKFCKNIQLLIATEDSHLLFYRLCNSSFQALDSIKDRISEMFTDTFYCKRSSTHLINTRTSRDNERFHYGFQDLIAASGSEYHQKTEDWSPPDKNSEGGGDPEVVFNVLDAILKCSLDRLKLMRENMSWAHIGHYNYTLKASYTQHIDTIRNLSLDGKLGVALCLWNKLIHKGVVPDVVTHNYLVHGFCKVGTLEKAEWLVREMCCWGPSPNAATYNTLMKGYCAFNDIDKALDLLSTMTDGKVRRIDEACYLYTVMSRMGVAPDWISYNILIQGLCVVGDVSTAHELLTFMLEKSMVPAPHIWNIIIDGYGKHGYKQIALHIRDMMMTYGVLPNVFTYNALIHMLIEGGEIDEAHSLMKEMLLAGPLPDVVTYNLLVGAESKSGHLYSAYQVYDDMLKRGYDPDIVTYTELIKGYCMRGKIEEAHRIFGFDMLQDSNLAIDHVPFQILIKKHFKMKDFDSAYGVYQKWLRMDRAE